MGNFECCIGDIVMFKVDGLNEVWVVIICDFVEDDGEGNKVVSFMWFFFEKEIRNCDKKWSDFYWVSCDLNEEVCCERNVLIWLLE